MRDIPIVGAAHQPSVLRVCAVSVSIVVVSPHPSASGPEHCRGSWNPDRISQTVGFARASVSSWRKYDEVSVLTQRERYSTNPHAICGRADVLSDEGAQLVLRHDPGIHT